MEKIDLLEKLVAVQEQHIELMNDYNNLKISFEAYKEVKIGKINNLQNEIEQRKEENASLIEINDALTNKVVELKQQIEELQKLIPIELVDKEQENQ